MSGKMNYPGLLLSNFEERSVMKRVLGFLLIMAGLFAGLAPSASASDELVPAADEPALCGSFVASLVDYNEAVLLDCVAASSLNVLERVDPFNRSWWCHVDLSEARVAGLLDVADAAAFDFDWWDFCVRVIVRPTVTATAVPNPLRPVGSSFVDSDGALCTVVVLGVADCVDAVPAPSLAFTGVESSVLAYLGAGLIGFGAVALAARRRLEA